jgi:hypothetical protein
LTHHDGFPRYSINAVQCVCALSALPAILILDFWLIFGIIEVVTGITEAGLRRSGREWRRVCEGEGLEEIVPGSKDQKAGDRGEAIEELAA